MVGIDDLIWSSVREHGWKWQRGRVAVRGIIWHATRSGIAGRSAGQEYWSCLNWFRSPNNVVRDAAGNPWYGGMSNYVIGGGRVCLAVPDEFVPRFSAGVHDFFALSVELGQATNGDPYDPRDIELARRFAEDKAHEYGFRLGRLPFVDGNNSQWPGEVGHEDTAQGRGQGKTDPGPLFWSAYLREREDEPMTPAERRLLAVAGGDYDAMLRAYNALVARGLLPDEGISGHDDLNSAVVKRFRILSLAGGDAEAAVAALG